jgi:hypothetical protein
MTQKISIVLILILTFSCSNSRNDTEIRKLSPELVGTKIDSLLFQSKFHPTILSIDVTVNPDLYEGLWSFKYEGNDTSIFWKNYSNSENTFSINYPKNWELNPQENTLFCVAPDASSVKEYIVILEYDHIKYQFKLENYVVEVYNQILRDKKEPIINYGIQEMEFSGERIFNFYAITVKDNVYNLLRGCYFVYNNKVFDVGYRLELTDDNPINYSLYLEMVKSIINNNTYSDIKIIRDFEIREIFN